MDAFFHKCWNHRVAGLITQGVEHSSLLFPFMDKAIVAMRAIISQIIFYILAFLVSL